MHLVRIIKEVLMSGPMNEVEQRLEDALTTKEAIDDVTKHLVQLLVEHKVQHSEEFIKYLKQFGSVGTPDQ